MTDRENLEYLVYIMIDSEQISTSLGKMLLSFQYMEDFNKWYDNYNLKEFLKKEHHYFQNKIHN